MIMISFEENGDMILSLAAGGAVYIGRVDSDGNLRLVPGNLEIVESEVIADIIAIMNYDPEPQEGAWNTNFTKAVVKAGEKARIPDVYLRQARLEEYREPDMSEWWGAVREAENRDECHDGDGNITARFWTDGERIWPTPGNIIERDARQIEYQFEAGIGYVPTDL